MIVEIFINFHHVENSSWHNNKTALFHELIILCPHCRWKFHKRQLSNIVTSLYTKAAIGKWEQESKGTEVVTLRKVCPKSARHLPEFPFTVRKGLFISEVISIAFHRNSKTLSKNIISCCWIFLGSFYFKLICLISNSLAEIWICL